MKSLVLIAISLKQSPGLFRAAYVLFLSLMTLPRCDAIPSAAYAQGEGRENLDLLSGPLFPIFEVLLSF